MSRLTDKAITREAVAEVGRVGGFDASARVRAEIFAHPHQELAAAGDRLLRVFLDGRNWVDVRVSRRDCAQPMVDFTTRILKPLAIAVVSAAADLGAPA